MIVRTLTLDLTGFLCPIPVHETRRAIEESESGDVIVILSDDPESLHDIPALCARKHYSCGVETLENRIFRFRVEKD